MRTVPLGLGVALVGCWLDQWSKGIILEKLAQPPFKLSVFSFFDLRLVFNPGVSFGFFPQSSSYGTWVLVGLAVAITSLMLYWLFKASDSFSATGLGLIIGGAVGNIIDRLRLGAVVDFLDFHWHGFSFPAFNLADTWITMGAGLLVISELLLIGKKKT